MLLLKRRIRRYPRLPVAGAARAVERCHTGAHWRSHAVKNPVWKSNGVRVTSMDMCSLDLDVIRGVVKKALAHSDFW